MNRLIGVVGNTAALLGILVCLIAGGARVVGRFYVGDVQIQPLFLVGVALMVGGCLAKLHLLTTK